MPAYDSTNFRPPAPVALVTLRSSKSAASIADVPMLLDTGADVSLVPRDVISGAISFSADDVQYEIEAFDGAKSTSPTVELENAIPRQILPWPFSSDRRQIRNHRPQHPK